MEEVKICCICGKEIKSILDCNNPYPVSVKPDDVCCPLCNGMFVIPERIKRLTNSRR